MPTRPTFRPELESLEDRELLSATPLPSVLLLQQQIAAHFRESAEDVLIPSGDLAAMLGAPEGRLGAGEWTTTHAQLGQIRFVNGNPNNWVEVQGGRIVVNGGRGPLSAIFETPRFVRSVTVDYIDGMAEGRISFDLADGTTRTTPLGKGGSFAVEAEVQAIRLETMKEERNRYGLRSIEFRPDDLSLHTGTLDTLLADPDLRLRRAEDTREIDTTPELETLLAEIDASLAEAQARGRELGAAIAPLRKELAGLERRLDGLRAQLPGATGRTAELLTQAIAALEGTSAGDSVIEWTETPGIVALYGAANQNTIRFSWTDLPAGTSAAIVDNGVVHAATPVAGASGMVSLPIPHRPVQRVVEVVLLDAGGAPVKTLAAWIVASSALRYSYSVEWRLPEFARLEERTVPRGRSVADVRAEIETTAADFIEAEALEASLLHTRAWLEGRREEIEEMETHGAQDQATNRQPEPVAPLPSGSVTAVFAPSRTGQGRNEMTGTHERIGTVRFSNGNSLSVLDVRGGGLAVNGGQGSLLVTFAQARYVEEVTISSPWGVGEGMLHVHLATGERTAAPIGHGGTFRIGAEILDFSFDPMKHERNAYVLESIEFNRREEEPAPARETERALPETLHYRQIAEPNLAHVFRERAMETVGLVNSDAQSWARLRHPDIFAGTDNISQQYAVLRQVWDALQQTHLVHAALLEAVYDQLLAQKTGGTYDAMAVERQRNDLLRRNALAGRYLPVLSAADLRAAVDRHFPELYAIQRHILADEDIYNERISYLSERGLMPVSGEFPEGDEILPDESVDRRLDRIARLIAQTLAESGDSRITAWHAAIGGQEQTRVADATMQSADGIGGLLEGIDVLLSQARERMRGSTLQSAYQDALSWYAASTSIPGNLETTISPTSQMGRIFLGLAQRLWAADSDINRAVVALQAEAVTSVSAAHLLSLGRGSPDVFARGLKRLFENAGYGFLTGQDSLTLGTNGSVMPMGASLSATSPNGMRVHVGWGAMPTPSSGEYRPLSVGIYLVKADTGEQIAVLEEGIRHRFFTTVDLTPYVFSSREVALKVVQYFEEGRTTESGYRHLTAVAQTRGFVAGPEGSNTLNTSNLNLSTLPNDDQQKWKEEIILNAVKASFPLHNAPEWRWDLGSSFHNGNSYHAADLNLGSGTFDEGQQVVATADGTIHINPTYGTVTLSHVIPTDEGNIFWQTKYLHLRIFPTTRNNIDGQIIFEIRDANNAVIGEIFNGMAIKAGDLIGSVGGKGPNGYNHFVSHLHLEVIVNGQSIDMRKLLVNHIGMKVTAEDSITGRRYFVEYSEDLKAWVTTDYQSGGEANPHLVFDRSAQEDGGMTSRWIELSNYSSPIIEQ